MTIKKRKEKRTTKFIPIRMSLRGFENESRLSSNF